MICPVCSYAFAVAGPDASGRAATLVDCNHCGKFGLTGSLVACLPTLLAQRDAAPKLSHVIRRAHETGQLLLLDSYTTEAILENPLPRPRFVLRAIGSVECVAAVALFGQQRSMLIGQI